MCCVKLYEYLSISVKRSKIMLDTIPCCRGEKNCISPQCNAVRITKKFTETPMHRCWRQNWMHWKSQPLYSFVAYSLHALSACAFTDNFFSISLSLSLSLRVALVKSIRKKKKKIRHFLSMYEKTITVKYRGIETKISRETSNTRSVALRIKIPTSILT